MKRIIALGAIALLFAEVASADVGLVLACTTQEVSLEGKETGTACSAKRWTAIEAGKVVAACQTAGCDINKGSTWQRVHKLTAASKVYRCSANIAPDKGGGWTDTLNACPQKAWGSFTPPPVVEPPPPPPPPVEEPPPVVARTVTITWTPPTTNEDGTALTDLDGYVLRYGRDGGLDQQARIVPGLVRYQVPALGPGLWRFTLAAVNKAGKESSQTSPVSAQVEAPPPDPKTPSAPTGVTIVIEVGPSPAP